MNLDEKANGTILKLLQLTAKGELEWRRTTDTRQLVLATNEVVPVAYVATLAGNRFALYEKRFRTMDEDANVYWDDQIMLQLIDEEGTPIWPFPRSPNLYALLGKVAAQAAGVEARLDEILNF